MNHTETPTADQEVTVFACGPSNQTCKCTCGVKGVEHICEHTFEDWLEFEDPDGGGGGTSVCSRCGMTAMSHSMWCF
jgi:hypothetical protein